MTKIQNMHWMPFLFHILDSFVFTQQQERQQHQQQKEANLACNVFTPDHNRSIIQKNNASPLSRVLFWVQMSPGRNLG